MKYITLFICLVMLACSFPNGAHAEAPALRIIKNKEPFSLSADFDLRVGSKDEGRVARTGGLSARYFYDYYDAEEEFQARGITRAFSWGLLYSWGIEIDIYDVNEFYIGFIQGQFYTAARAKFVFYDEFGVPSIIAYLNTDKPEFLLVSAHDESNHIAKMHIDNYGDICSVRLEKLQSHIPVDTRIFRIFGAFVADYNREFFPPPQVVYYPVYHQTTVYIRD